MRFEEQNPPDERPRPTTSASHRDWVRPAQSVLVLPLIYEGQVRGVLETGDLRRVQPHAPGLPRAACRVGSRSCSTRSTPTAPEDLLKQSQSLAHQLQIRQEELQQTNEELQEKARLLARRTRKWNAKTRK